MSKKNCHYFIKRKGRFCLNNSLNNQPYCYHHQGDAVATPQKVSPLPGSKTPSRRQKGGGKDEKDVYVSPYVLMSSQLPPNPEQQSWYHYQAPNYQSFGDYICIKRSFLNDSKNIINDIFRGEPLPLK